jgi:chaperonin cofactor prefoldin
VTWDEVERTMQFLLEQQARTAAALDQEREERKGRDEQMNRQMEQFRADLEGMRQHLNTVQRAYGTALLQLTEHLETLSKDVATLRVAGAATDERLNALIQVVDGLIRRPEQP